MILYSVAVSKVVQKLPAEMRATPGSILHRRLSIEATESHVSLNRLVSLRLAMPGPPIVPAAPVKRKGRRSVLPEAPVKKRRRQMADS